MAEHLSRAHCLAFALIKIRGLSQKLDRLCLVSLNLSGLGIPNVFASVFHESNPIPLAGSSSKTQGIPGAVPQDSTDRSRRHHQTAFRDPQGRFSPPRPLRHSPTEEAPP